MKIREIANICFGSGGHGLIVGIQAYFDCSGQNNSHILTVGGYVAADHICDEIENKWKEALLDAGYREPNGEAGIFHLADFGTSGCRYGSAQWDLQTRRVPLLKKLAGIVNRPENHLVSLSVETSQYKDFLSTSPNPLIWGPDYFSGCALMAFVLVEAKVEQAGLGKESIAYVFEKGDREHEMHHAFDEYEADHPELDGRRSLAFVPKRLPLLQGADLTAGKINEILERAEMKLGFLDSGNRLTPVSNFERYYSLDGTSEALMKDCGVHWCVVANKSHFEEADKRIIVTTKNNPSILERRLKRKLPILSHEKRN